jgi:hypothetical protein
MARIAAGKQTSHLRQFDPFRRPSWRWDLAGRIARGEVPRRNDLDAVAAAAVAFRQTCEPPEAHPCARRHLGSLDHDIASVVELHEAGGPLAWEIESRIVAGQDDITVATCCGLSPRVVGLYERLFFNVRECLDSRAYLMRHVVGHAVWEGFRNDQVGRFWAWAALSGGAAVLDLLVTSFYMVHVPGQPPALSGYLTDVVDLPLQSFVASSVLPMNGAVAGIHAGLHAGLAKADTVGTGRDDVQRDLVRCAREYLAGKPVFDPQMTKSDCRHERRNRPAVAKRKPNKMFPNGLAGRESMACGTSTASNHFAARPSRSYGFSSDGPHAQLRQVTELDPPGSADQIESLVAYLTGRTKRDGSSL